MKRICCIKILAAALPWLLPTGCDKASEPQYGPTKAETVSIAALKALSDGSDATPIRHEVVIRGRITANDHFGEFYKTLVLEDGFGGISLAIDGEELFHDYPCGYPLTVRCNGLALCDYGGKLVLGTETTEDGPGRIPPEELSRHLTVGETDGSRPRPRTLTFDAVSTGDIDCYVRFDKVRFPDAGTWCRTDPETNRYITTEHRITDTAGNEFTVRVVSTCSYASEPVPSGTGSLCGIIDYFNGKFSLRVVNNEVLFNN